MGNVANVRSDLVCLRSNALSRQFLIENFGNAFIENFPANPSCTREANTFSGSINTSCVSGTKANNCSATYCSSGLPSAAASTLRLSYWRSVMSTVRRLINSISHFRAAHLFTNVPFEFAPLHHGFIRSSCADSERYISVGTWVRSIMILDRVFEGLGPRCEPLRTFSLDLILYLTSLNIANF